MSSSYEQITTGEIILAGIPNSMGSQSITVLLKDATEKILLATGTTLPTDGDAIFAKGCLFIDTDVATGTSGLYTNVGTSTSCVFKLITNA
jgi:hypothetical protein